MSLKIDLPSSFPLSLTSQGQWMLPAIHILPGQEDLRYLLAIDLTVEGPDEEVCESIAQGYVSHGDYPRKMVDSLQIPQRASRYDKPFSQQDEYRITVTLTHCPSRFTGGPNEKKKESTSAHCQLLQETVEEPSETFLRILPKTLSLNELGKESRLQLEVVHPPHDLPTPLLTIGTVPTGDEALSKEIKRILSQEYRLISQTPGSSTYEAIIHFKIPAALKRAWNQCAEQGPLSIRLRSEIPSASLKIDHDLVIESTSTWFPGWVAIDFGTSNSSVALFDPNSVTQVTSLPIEQEERLRQLLLSWLQESLTPSPDEAQTQWKLFLDQVDQHLQKIRQCSLMDALQSKDSSLFHTAIRSLETLLQHEPESVKSLCFWRLHQIYQEVFRIPSIESQNMFPVQLDPNEPFPTLPSEMEILQVQDPIVVRMGHIARQNRFQSLTTPGASSGAANALQHTFHPSPKRYFGQTRDITIAAQSQQRNLPAQRLIQAAWDHLLQLTSEFRERDAHRFSRGPDRRAVLTYPTIAPPSVRKQCQDMLTEIGIAEPQTDYDEATAAAIFFLMREFGGGLDIGLEAFKVRCQNPSQGTWTQNVLLFDMGGGTTDIALIRLKLREENPFAPNEFRGAGGRYYVISPEIRGSSGHLQLGGELLTLKTFQLLKLLLVNHLLILQQDDKIKWPRLASGLDGLDREFKSNGKYLPDSLPQALYRSDDSLPKALDAAEEILPTRWRQEPQRLPTFHALWELAEEAKIKLGRRKRHAEDLIAPFVLRGEKMIDLLRSVIPDANTGPLEELLEFSIPLTSFEMVARPVVAEAVRIAKGLVASRLKQDATGQVAEKLDWLILSGQSSNLHLVDQEIRRAFASGEYFVWNPQRVTFIQEYSKIATSMGACWAERLRNLLIDPQGAKPLLLQGSNQLYFDVSNLFFSIPASFVRQMQETTAYEPIFAAGQELKQMDAEPEGKLRSDWRPVQLAHFLYREDFRDQERKPLWFQYSANGLVNRLQIPERLWQTEYRIQFEINHRLIVHALLCQGTPHYQMDDSVPSLEIKSALGKNLYINVHIDPIANPPLVFSGQQEFNQTFHLPNGAVSQGLISDPLPALPYNGKYLFYTLEKDPQGKETMKRLGELTPPKLFGDYQYSHFATLDSNGTLRLYAGSVPYWHASSEEDLKTPGKVFRAPDQPVQVETKEDRNPFSGIH